MVEYSLELDNIFGALADPTRRDILRRIVNAQLNVGQLAADYNLTFAAVSKHLKVLEKAKLIIKNKVGRKQYVRIQPSALKDVDDFLEFYRQIWEDRFDRLDKFLNETKG